MTDNSGKAIQKYRVYIKATPQAVWDALTKPEWSVRYGYAPLVDYDLRAGGQFPAYPNEGMKHFPNIPDIIIDGEVVEANAPHKLVQTWRMLMEPQLTAEGFTRLSVDIEAVRGGVTKLTITHDLTNAPIQTALYSGEWESKGAGGGWYEVLSGLKTLLETGAQLPFQSGPGRTAPKTISSSHAKPNERKCHDQLRYEEVPCSVSRSRFGHGRVVEN